MPQMGVSVAEGTLAVWHKRVGDWVQADETICEISTDKIDVEVPSPASGRLIELLVREEETVPVGAVLARIDIDAARGDAHPAEALISPEHDRPRAPGHSPLVRRIAAEHGVDLTTITGTGRGGRIRKQDVLRALERRDEAPSSVQSSRPRTEEPEPARAGEPLSRMRRAIAEHMTRSLRTAAHCTTIIEVDMTRVERERARQRFSPLPFVARAVTEALQAHPALNATFEEDLLIRHGDVNLGIAVSLGDDGLIVPVIHGAQRLSLAGLAERISELADRARARELTPDEVRGGTFTITNPGCFGSLASTPIINQPQVAILDLETVRKRAVVITGDDGADAIAIRPMACLCLSWDHRTLDGAQAAQFLGTVRARIEEP
jgi:pyruvate/2-oxoglutarate dehydrogenase complex dihydrolipoamide acyltransferase (E2) component